MSDDGDTQNTAGHVSAAINDIRKAMSELSVALGAHERSIGEDILRPAHNLARGVVGLAEMAVDPMAEFVERQRELADQMAAWAELQHQLADHMAAWADLQRQLAGAFSLWLAPAGGAAKVTRRVLHQLDGTATPKNGTVRPPRARARA